MRTIVPRRVRMLNLAKVRIKKNFMIVVKMRT